MSTQATKLCVYTDWQSTIVFSADGPKPQILLDTTQFKVVLVGLEAGQKIPPHPAPAAVYHVLEGSGWIVVVGERKDVMAGSIVVVPDSVPRGFEAKTRLAFIGSRGADV